PYIEGARFLDLYAGTGAIGIEALSRGARRVVFVESHAASLRLLQANLIRCQLMEEADVQARRAEEFLCERLASTKIFDIVFADPPYEFDSAGQLLPSLERSAIIGPKTIVLLEHPTKQAIPSQIGRLGRDRHYHYGDTSLSRFTVVGSELPLL
ncbi:MAG: RsmD family RNA methyltransferase, partial [Candidatus Binatia bacterium]